MSASCRSCGAEIIWAFTKAGKRMPLDAEPNRFAGTFALELIEGSEREEFRAVAKGDLPEGSQAWLYRSHYASCPEAKKWRKKK